MCHCTSRDTMKLTKQVGRDVQTRYCAEVCRRCAQICCEMLTRGIDRQRLTKTLLSVRKLVPEPKNAWHCSCYIVWRVLYLGKPCCRRHLGETEI